MNKWLINGFVSPNDFSGTDAECLQMALDSAREKDVCKVVIDNPLVCDKAILLPDNIHVIFAADVTADFICFGEANFSLAQKNVFLEGNGGIIKGSITFFNSEMTVLTGLTVNGDVSFTYSRKVRMENCTVNGTLTIGRGTENSVFQYLSAENILIAAKAYEKNIPGRGDDIRGVFLRDSKLISGSVTLLGADDAKIEYMLIDGIKAPNAAIVVGDPAAPKPKEQYVGLSICNIDAPQKTVFHDTLLRAYLDL